MILFLLWSFFLCVCGQTFLALPLVLVQVQAGEQGKSKTLRRFGLHLTCCLEWCLSKFLV